jgi:hypothetical protein
MVLAGCRRQAVWSGAAYNAKGDVLRLAADEPFCGCLDAKNTSNAPIVIRSRVKLEGDQSELAERGRCVVRAGREIREPFDWAGPKAEDVYELDALTLDDKPLIIKDVLSVNGYGWPFTSCETKCKPDPDTLCDPDLKAERESDSKTVRKPVSKTVGMPISKTVGTFVSKTVDGLVSEIAGESDPEATSKSDQETGSKPDQEAVSKPDPRIVSKLCKPVTVCAPGTENECTPSPTKTECTPSLSMNTGDLHQR